MLYFLYVYINILRKSIRAIRFSVKYDLRFQDRSFDVRLPFDLKLLLEVELLFHLEIIITSRTINLISNCY